MPGIRPNKTKTPLRKRIKLSDDFCPLMSLPDEVLCQIFSFITDIPFKMSLERVCKRFQKISTTQTNSWNGNDKLEMVTGCNLLDDELAAPAVDDGIIKYLAHCPTEYDTHHYFNSYNISLNKWPKAIEQFLQRSVVRKLCIHLNSVVVDDLPLLDRIFEVIQNGSNRLRLGYIEFHRQDRVANALQQLSDKLYLFAVAGSAKTLETIVLSVQNNDISEGTWTEICSGVQACPNLNSFSIRMRSGQKMMRLSGALQGKSLKSLTVSTWVHHPQLNTAAKPTDPLTQFLMPISQNATVGCIATSLKVESDFNEDQWWTGGLIDFANTIYGPTRDTLVELILGQVSTNRFVADLDQLPLLFPNLKRLHLFDTHVPDGPLNVNSLCNTQFFTVCDETPLVERKVTFSFAGIADVVGFPITIDAWCEQQGIEALHGEGYEENALTLKKGNVTIVIERILMLYDGSMLSSSDEEDDDEDGE